MTAFVDTNVLVRHLTGDPPDLAERATAYLGTERELLLTDLVAAETVYVWRSPFSRRSVTLRHRFAFTRARRR